MCGGASAVLGVLVRMIEAGAGRWKQTGGYWVAAWDAAASTAMASGVMCRRAA